MAASQRAAKTPPPRAPRSPAESSSAPPPPPAQKAAASCSNPARDTPSPDAHQRNQGKSPAPVATISIFFAPSPMPPDPPDPPPASAPSAPRAAHLISQAPVLKTPRPPAAWQTRDRYRRYSISPAPAPSRAAEPPSAHAEH